jgi:hypothetical protein
MSIPAKVQVNITELRGIGAVPISFPGVIRHYFLTVPREAVEVSSLSGGIQGIVNCTIVDQTDKHYAIQIPQAPNGTERIYVPREIVTTE